MFLQLSEWLLACIIEEYLNIQLMEFEKIKILLLHIFLRDLQNIPSLLLQILPMKT